MKSANILSALLGTVLALISLQWIFAPEAAAGSLNMLYLEGEGRNTQIRDFTAFFLGTAIMSFLSLITKKYEWIFSVGIIYLFAAIFNVLASLNHDAPLAISSLVSEIIFFSIAFAASALYKSSDL